MLFVHTLHVFFLWETQKLRKLPFLKATTAFCLWNLNWNCYLYTIRIMQKQKLIDQGLRSDTFFLVFKWPFRRWKVTYVTSNLGDPKVTTGRNKGIGCSPNLPWGRQGIAWNKSSPFVQVRKKIWSKHRWILVFLPCEWEHKSLKLLPIA